MKLKEYKGFNYSLESFEDYKLRVKFKFITKDYEQDIEIYTNETRHDKILEFIDENKTDKVLDFQVIDWFTRSHDDACSELISGFLKEDKN